jgi:hypothetical protein
MNIFKFWANDTLEQNNTRFQIVKRLLINMINQNIDVTIEIKETKKKTSDKARGYIFGVIIPLALQGLCDLGNEIPNNNTGKEYVYQFLKAQGGFFEIKEIKMADMTKKTFAEFESFGQKGDLKRQCEFIDFCGKWCAENLNVVLPDPEVWKRENGFK